MVVVVAARAVVAAVGSVEVAVQWLVPIPFTDLLQVAVVVVAATEVVLISPLILLGLSQVLIHFVL